MHQTQSDTLARYSKRLTILILVIATNQLFAAYEIKKHSINNGGAKISSNRFQLNASIAQVDANQALSSNQFKLSPGFWQKLPTVDLIFNNGFE
jgi:hypothetical protein